jgi:IS30 family transposase
MFTEKTNMPVFFAHASCPWERGTNENTNGLIRDYFPKGTDFSKVSRRSLKSVERLLNNRPRKVLGWQTPNQAFRKNLRLEMIIN